MPLKFCRDTSFYRESICRVDIILWKNLHMNQSLMNVQRLLQNIFLSYVLLWDPLGWNHCLVFLWFKCLEFFHKTYLHSLSFSAYRQDNINYFFLGCGNVQILCFLKNTDSLWIIWTVSLCELKWNSMQWGDIHTTLDNFAMTLCGVCM